MKQPKTPSAIEHAKAFIKAKSADIAVLKTQMQEAEAALRRGIDALRQAQEAADALLPQCRIVTVSNRPPMEMAMARAVILRQTPAGSLIVRYFGDDESSFTYKYNRFTDRFVLQKRPGLHHFNQPPELRDVPEPFLSKGKKAHA